MRACQALPIAERSDYKEKIMDMLLKSLVSSLICFLAMSDAYAQTGAVSSGKTSTPTQVATAANVEALMITKFKAADTNGDGAVTLQEAQAGKLEYTVKYFKEIDKNSDGKINQAELENALRARIKHQADNAIERFHAADKDRDNALTKEEAEAGGLKRLVADFKLIDTNRDNKVSLEELQAMLRKTMQPKDGK